MKHISGMSKQTPIVADDIQEIICIANSTMQDLLELKGDRSTAKDFIEGKCDLPGDGV